MNTDMGRLNMILTKDDMNRIQEYPDRMSLALHGKTKKEAKRLLNNVINTIRHPFTMEVIHGYNHGTVLKDMIFEEMINPRIITKDVPFYNIGETILYIK